MASLGIKDGIYLARFRYGGRAYKRSLKTPDRKDAEAALLEVKRTLHWLHIGRASVPEGVDPGDYVVSGGTLTAPAPAPTPPVPRPSLAEVAAQYQEHLAHLAASHRYTIGVHLRNLARKLGGKMERPADEVGPLDLERYLQDRLKERARTTVAKERETLVQFFAWAARCHLGASPASGLTPVKSSPGLDPFRTVAEVEAVAARGGLGPQEQLSLWDSLYLEEKDIAEVLALVRARARDPISHLLHAVPAYTGMRRGELLRLRWGDIDFRQGSLVARSRKQSRQEEETQRRIDLHPDLAALLRAWQAAHPRGQYVFCRPGTLEPMTGREAERKFWQPLRGTGWCLASRRNRFKIGFHTYRHSFASNLTAKGVDQRTIDQWMGHVSEAMRRRYRHLAPALRQSAISSLSYAGSENRAGAPSVDRVS